MQGQGAVSLTDTKDWLKNATEIQPNLWISNYEISVEDYQVFLHFMLNDSGEAMYRALLPNEEFWGLGHIPPSFFQDRDELDFGSQKGAPFPIESDHPVIGLSQAQANAYCDWLTRTMMQVHLYDGKSFPYPENVSPLITFRLPTAEEWELAGKAAQQAKAGEEYASRPSRYLKTRPASEGRKGETIFHLGDNVSEMTSETAVVMGGNFETEGLGRAQLSGEKPDLRMGFRIVGEVAAGMLKRILSVRSIKEKPRKDYRGVNKIQKNSKYKNEHYPFQLEKMCFEIEPNIWMTKEEVGVGLYSYFLFHILRDRGEVFARMHLPGGLDATANQNASNLVYEYSHLLNPSKPMEGLSSGQFHRFLEWMTTRNYFVSERKANGGFSRFWFREPAIHEIQLAKQQNPDQMASESEDGFRFVIEVMPVSPSMEGVKWLPYWLTVQSLEEPSPYSIWPGPVRKLKSKMIDDCIYK